MDTISPGPTRLLNLSKLQAPSTFRELLYTSGEWLIMAHPCLAFQTSTSSRSADCPLGKLSKQIPGRFWWPVHGSSYEEPAVGAPVPCQFLNYPWCFCSSPCLQPFVISSVCPTEPLYFNSKITPVFRRDEGSRPSGGERKKSYWRRRQGDQPYLHEYHRSYRKRLTTRTPRTRHRHPDTSTIRRLPMRSQTFFWGT